MPAFVLMIMLALATTAHGDTFTVTSLNDTGGPFELRWAIDLANLNPGADTISFSLAGGILLSSSLPGLTDDETFIDGTTAPDDYPGPDILIDGGGDCSITGLSLHADDCIIVGLAVVRCGIGIDVNMGPYMTSTRRNVVGRPPERELVVVSGNCTMGIQLMDETTTDNEINHCFIGTDHTGTVARPNGLIGVVITGGASHNFVGSDTEPAPTNVISANGQHGVFLGWGRGNIVSKCFVGTDITGMGALANGANGIELMGMVTEARIRGCLLSGNTRNGVTLGQGAFENYVMDTRIGVDITGMAALANGESGVLIQVARRNEIGPANVISGNTLAGVVMDGLGCDTNRVVGSRIGTDDPGTGAVPNGTAGVLILNGPKWNNVGGCLVSGNTGSGIAITGSETQYNGVTGSNVGVDVTGLTALANGAHGVIIAGVATYNTIGGAATSGNVIAGHADVGMCGVHITDPETAFNEISHNIIGLDANGDAALPNYHGVQTTNNAVLNEIGPNNVISGNTDVGVLVEAGTQNVVENLIGLAADGVSARPNRLGIWIATGTNTITGNYVSANTETGILAGTGCTPGNNEFDENRIGLDVDGNAAGNGGDGMWFHYDAPDNTIGLSSSTGNVIWYNGGNGICVGGPDDTTVGPFDNLIQYNSISQNDLLGIENQYQGNNETTPPVVTNVTATTIEGTAADAGTIQAFYSSDDEGATYVGEVVIAVAGGWTVSATAPDEVYVTATVTPTGTWDTSEFSTAYWVEGVSGAEDESIASVVSARNQLSPIRPNPFLLHGGGGAASCRLDLARSAWVGITLHDVAGRGLYGAFGGVREMPAGPHTLSWDGSMPGGGDAPAGCYFLRVEVVGRTYLRSFVLIR